MGRPPKSESRDVRALILREAARVISETGEQSVRTKNIAAAIGVTEPALFHYFKNREALIEEALAFRFENTQSDFLVAFRDAVLKCATRDEFRSTVIAALEATFSPKRRANREARISIAGSAISRPGLTARLVASQRHALAPLIAALDHAREMGWLRKDFDSAAFAYWFTAQTTGRYFAELENDERLLESMNDIVYRALMTEMQFDQ